MFSHYLMFNRNCANALEVYAKAFGAEIKELQKYGDMPNPGFPIADNDKNLILHSRLQWGNTEIMCADSTEYRQPGRNMYISITTKDAALVKRAWDILKLDGEIYMELSQTFFAKMHGSLQDQFGINWMLTALK
jgi:PhnB protein